MNAISFYATTLLVYFGVDVLAAWGLNLQYGLYGMYNFAFILFQSVGAYTAAVMTLGRPSHQFGGQQYFFGASLPFPIPIIVAGLVAGILGLVVAAVVARGMRSDYEAIVTFVIAVMALLVVGAVIPLLNGESGLSLVPKPLASTLHMSSGSYAWLYVAFVAAVCLVSYEVLRRVQASPLGRSVRAVRENANGAAALGVNSTWCRIVVTVLGACMAGVSGALLVLFIGTWSPGSWSYAETLVIFSAIIVGGVGNNIGVMIGVFATQIVFAEGSRYLPASLPPNLVGSLQWIVIGVLTLTFLWVRPQGLVPERRQCVPPPRRGSGRAVPAAATAPATVIRRTPLVPDEGELR
jgi:branched-chain amino acid transport system permease protein